MINRKSTKTGMEKALEGLRVMRAAIMQNAPRDGGHDIAWPYSGWLKKLDVDIEKATKWLKFGEAEADLDKTPD